MPDLDLSKLAVQLDAALDDLRAGKGDPLASIEAVSAALAGTQTVWIANVEHKHGSDTGVFNTQRGAQLSLVQWADKYWDEEIDTDLDKPTNDDERMEAYFAWMQDHDRGEYYGIECLSVQYEPMEVITEVADIYDSEDEPNSYYESADRKFGYT